MACDPYGHLALRLRLFLCVVPTHLRAGTDTYDVLYSVFGVRGSVLRCCPADRGRAPPTRFW
ncbi:hypothetical protein J2X68_007873 [Streptomyces sp. 3330]|nr:hypothetical protein [Streptomyces sp. 3330]